MRMGELLEFVGCVRPLLLPLVCVLLLALLLVCVFMLVCVLVCLLLSVLVCVLDSVSVGVGVGMDMEGGSTVSNTSRALKKLSLFIVVFVNKQSSFDHIGITPIDLLTA